MNEFITSIITSIITAIITTIIGNKYFNQLMRRFQIKYIVKNNINNYKEAINILNQIKLRCHQYSNNDFENLLIEKNLISLNPYIKICYWLLSENDLDYFILLCQRQK